MPVDLRQVVGADPKKPEVSQHVVDDPQFASGDQLLLGPAIAHPEEHVLIDRHHEGLRGHPTQCGGEVPAGVPADVTTLLDIPRDNGSRTSCSRAVSFLSDSTDPACIPRTIAAAL